MAPPQTLYNVKIISTNKIDMEFVNSLELHGLVWCLNPLFKYYQQTKDTLDCLEQARLERLRGR